MRVYLSAGERLSNLFKAVKIFFRGVVIGREPIYNVDEGKWEIMSRMEALDLAYAYLDTFLCGYMYIVKCESDVDELLKEGV